MTTSFHVGDRVSRRLGDQVFHGVVVGVYEDFVMVQWDTGVLAMLDEPAASTLTRYRVVGGSPLVAWYVRSTTPTC
jgi:hypothetical protein